MAKETQVTESTDTDLKFTEEELQQLQGLQGKYQEKQAMFGQLGVHRVMMNQEMDALETRQVELEDEYIAVQAEERELVKTLSDKYGNGQLDPTTGIFTPTITPAD